MKKKVVEAINAQIQAEFYSAYLYLAMSASLEMQNFKGMASWMKLQAKEEVAHAMKFFDFLHERGQSVGLETIEQPPLKWDSPLEIFEEAYAHEKKVTHLIENLLEVAKEQKDYASEIFLQWFITEQVEEEANTSEILNKLKMANGMSGALLFLDAELGSRK